MPTAEDVRQSSPFFRRLSEVDLERLASIAITKVYEKGETVFSEGDSPAYLHTLASGPAGTPGRHHLDEETQALRAHRRSRKFRAHGARACRRAAPQSAAP